MSPEEKDAGGLEIWRIFTGIGTPGFIVVSLCNILMARWDLSKISNWDRRRSFINNAFSFSFIAFIQLWFVALLTLVFSFCNCRWHWMYQWATLVVFLLGLRYNPWIRARDVHDYYKKRQELNANVAKLKLFLQVDDETLIMHDARQDQYASAIVHCESLASELYSLNVSRAEKDEEEQRELNKIFVELKSIVIEKPNIL